MKASYVVAFIFALAYSHYSSEGAQPARPGEVIGIIENAAGGISVSPAEKWLASFDSSSVKLWELKNARRIPNPECIRGERIWTGTFCHDGKLAVAIQRSGWEKPDGKGEAKIMICDLDKDTHFILGYANSAVTEMALSPDGKWLATGASGGDQRVSLWDLTQMKRQAALEYDGSTWELSFNPSSSLLAVGVNDTVSIVSTKNWELKHTIKFEATLQRATFVDEDRLACISGAPVVRASPTR